jgi:hypothetical protein
MWARDAAPTAQQQQQQQQQHQQQKEQTYTFTGSARLDGCIDELAACMQSNCNCFRTWLQGIQSMYLLLLLFLLFYL